MWSWALSINSVTPGNSLESWTVCSPHQRICNVLNWAPYMDSTSCLFDFVYLFSTFSFTWKLDSHFSCHKSWSSSCMAIQSQSAEPWNIRITCPCRRDEKVRSLPISHTVLTLPNSKPDKINSCAYIIMAGWVLLYTYDQTLWPPTLMSNLCMYCITLSFESGSHIHETHYNSNVI